MSVKRDTTPRMTTFTVSPYARDRRVAMVSRRMEEERDGDDRVDHYEQCALVPVASPIRDDSRDDSRRQGQGRELEDFEGEGQDVTGQERNETETGAKPRLLSSKATPERMPVESTYKAGITRPMTATTSIVI